MMELLRDLIIDPWSDGLFGKLLALLVIAIFGLVLSLPYLFYKDYIWWKAYRVEHNCKATNETTTEMIWIPTTVNNSTTMTPIITTKQRWVCDNGAIWR